MVNASLLRRFTLELRAAARKAGDFEEADLAAEGVILEDQPGRTRWRLVG
jgi:cysteinyl-tRNA synthetase